MSRWQIERRNEAAIPMKMLARIFAPSSEGLFLVVGVSLSAAVLLVDVMPASAVVGGETFAVGTSVFFPLVGEEVIDTESAWISGSWLDGVVVTGGGWESSVCKGGSGGGEADVL